MSKAQRFIKKPIVVEAIQFQGFDEFQIIVDWAVENGQDAANFVFHGPEQDDPNGYMTVQTLEGIMRANIGDFIVCGVENEFYPCKPDIFEKSYSEDIQ